MDYPCHVFRNADVSIDGVKIGSRWDSVELGEHYVHCVDDGPNGDEVWIPREKLQAVRPQ